MMAQLDRVFAGFEVMTAAKVDQGQGRPERGRSPGQAIEGTVVRHALVSHVQTLQNSSTEPNRLAWGALALGVPQRPPGAGVVWFQLTPPPGSRGAHKEALHDLGARRGDCQACPKCPLCDGTEFDEQQGRMDSRWGLTSHKLVMKICRRRGLVLQFSAGRGIFDFD